MPDLVRDKPWNQLKEQNEPREIKFYHRGDHRQPTASLEPAVPRIAADEHVTRLVTSAAHPRLVLADWMASASNPLPARAMANRLWQSHFGRGLAGTPGDLGLAGLEPTHPELLDWLAVHLRDRDWSTQMLRREILLSATYQSRSFAADDGARDDQQKRLKADPDNEAYSRYPRRRMTGEVLRDSMLQVAGLLNRERGGPSVKPPLPEELVATLLPNQWKASEDPADHARRSVYVFARRNLRYPIFESFDRPDAGATCPARGQSVTATQSLLMFNSEFSHQIAAAIGDRVSRSATNTTQAATALWSDVLGRDPTNSECKLLEQLLHEFPDRRSGLTAAALGLLNSNEFISIE